MASNFRFAEGYQVYPVLGPISAASTTLQTYYVDCDQCHWLTFIVDCGAATSDDTDTLVVTVECSTADSSNATENAIGFWYRLTSAADTYSQGTITRATSDGIGTSDAINATDIDNKCLIIDVDPAEVAAKKADARWVRVVLTSTLVSGIEGAIVVAEPRYPGNTIPSST